LIIRNRFASRDLKRHGRTQPECYFFCSMGRKDHSVLYRLDTMMRSCIVESWCTHNAELDFAAYRPGTAYKRVRLANFFQRHEVIDFRNALLGKEARHQHI